MILHAFVDVGRWRTARQSGQQLITNDEQLHLRRVFDEHLLDFPFELLHLIDGCFGILMEVLPQHLLVDVVLDELLGAPFAGFFAFDVGAMECMR